MLITNIVDCGYALEKLVDVSHVNDYDQREIERKRERER
jgi:hypothetical protein